MPDRLGDPAPVRVAAVQRGLDQRGVGHGAGGGFDVQVLAAAHDDPPDPAGALAVAHEQRSRAGAGARRAPRRRRSSSSVSGSTRTPLAPEAMSTTVSLVESWPSTLMRSNERAQVAPSSRSQRRGVQRGVGLHEAEQGGEVRRDHARALGLGREPHRPAAERPPAAPRASRSRRWSGSPR